MLALVINRLNEIPISHQQLYWHHCLLEAYKYLTFTRLWDSWRAFTNKYWGLFLAVLSKEVLWIASRINFWHLIMWLVFGILQSTRLFLFIIQHVILFCYSISEFTLNYVRSYRALILRLYRNYWRFDLRNSLVCTYKG